MFGTVHGLYSTKTKLLEDSPIASEKAFHKFDNPDATYNNQ